MRIVGIDPGLLITGYGAIESIENKNKVIEAGVIRTNAKEDLGKRLLTIYSELGKVFEDIDPEVIAVEDLYSHYKMPKTAIIMGHARGIIFLLAGLRGIPIVSYPPAKVKSSVVGHGRATKEQVQLMIQTRLNLQEVPEPNDVADALAVALCHANTSSRPVRSTSPRALGSRNSL